MACGSIVNLEFDHKDRKKKNFCVTEKCTYSLETVLKELALCQLLCGVCHLAKTLKECNKAKHGTISMYRHHRCRCLHCRRAWNLKCREWKRKIPSSSNGRTSGFEPANGRSIRSEGTRIS